MEWISTDHRLPEYYEDVLVMYETEEYLVNFLRKDGTWDKEWFAIPLFWAEIKRP